MTAPRCLPVTEVASTLGVSRDSVYRLIESGALQGVQVGRRKVVPEDVLEAFIATGGSAA